MALKLGELVAVLGVDQEKFEQGLDKAHGKFQGFAEKLGPAAGVAGGAAAVALAEAFSGALEFDAAETKMAAQLGNASQADELGRIGGALYARGFAESIDEAMGAVRDVMAANLVPKGASDATIEEITRQVQAYASAWDVDVADATQHVSTLMKTGLAKDATGALDLLTASARKVPAALREDITDASDEYGQFFASLGFTGPQAFGVLTDAADKGTYGIDKAGDSIKEFTLLATDMSTNTQAAYKTLGLNAQATSNDLLAGGDRAQTAFQKIITGLRGIKDPTTQANTALAFFGTPLEDMNKSDIPAFLANLSGVGDGLDNVTGEAQKTADTLEGSVSQQMDVLKRSVQQALVEELAKALPTIRELAQWLGENRDIVVPLAETLGVLAIVIGTIIGVTKAWAIAQTALNVVMSMNPIGLVVLAIAALVAGIILLWNNSAGFRDFWIGAWNLIKGAALATWDWLKGAWSATTEWLTNAWRKAVSWVVGSWQWIKDAAASAKNWIVDKWNSLIDWFRSLPGRIGRAAHGMWDGIKDAFRSMVNWLIGKWNGLGFTIGGGSFAGINIPSMTFSTPDLPYLASGGNVSQGGMAEVGERGRERIFLPAGASVVPLRHGQNDTGGGTREVRHVIDMRLNGDTIRTLVFDGANERGQSPAEFLKVA